MNVKIFKFYQTIFDSAKDGSYKNPEEAGKFWRKVLACDFEIASELWEFLIGYCGDNMPAERLHVFLGEPALKAFYEHNKAKTVRLICDREAVNTLLYAVSPINAGFLSLEILVGLIVSQKLEDAEILLKPLGKNIFDKTYGQILKEIVESVFVELLKKDGSAKKVNMPKKTATFLLGYIDKIKTPEKAILQQRIKEIM